MYKLALYCLFVVAILAVLLGFLGKLPYNGVQLFWSAVFLMLFCYFFNYIFAQVLDAPATAESSIITALILFLVMQPAQSAKDLLVIFLVSLVAILSKYVFAINKKHIFNPAVVAAVVFGFSANWGATWWVANLYMMPIVCIAGFLIVKKIRRFPLFFACILGFFISFYFINGFESFFPSLKTILISWPLIFFATIMLTEPSTLPPHKNQQIIYGLLIGLFLGAPVRIFGNIYTTPEIVLAIGNIIAFSLSQKRKLKMEFVEKIQLAKDCYEFVFSAQGGPASGWNALIFRAGQFMEWSLPHKKQDSRGIRRYFTISSAPNEKYVKIGVRFNEKSSSFKTDLLNLKKGDFIFAGSLAGDFILPKKDKNELVFVAGGIGITPFVSMVRDLINKNEKADIVLFYANRTEDVPYADLLKTAEQKVGVKTIYLIGNEFLNEQVIKKHVPNLKDKIFYLSGPSAMVDNYKKLIKNMGVRAGNIKTDYFPGF